VKTELEGISWRGRKRTSPIASSSKAGVDVFFKNVEDPDLQEVVLEADEDRRRQEPSDDEGVEGGVGGDDGDVGRRQEPPDGRGVEEEEGGVEGGVGREGGSGFVRPVSFSFNSGFLPWKTISPILVVMRHMMKRYDQGMIKLSKDSVAVKMG
jgi:hypothetical protein